jgi:hypothetical protein
MRWFVATLVLLALLCFGTQSLKEAKGRSERARQSAAAQDLGEAPDWNSLKGYQCCVVHPLGRDDRARQLRRAAAFQPPGVMATR